MPGHSPLPALPTQQRHDCTWHHHWPGFSSVLHVVPGVRYYILLLFQYRKSEMTRGCWNKAFIQGARVHITCHGSRLRHKKNVQGHELGSSVNRTVLQTTVGQKTILPWPSMYCLQGEVPYVTIAQNHT